MFVLLAFAFLAGVVTILSPCILPVLPIVLSGVVGEGRRRPFGIVTGFILSFTFFTLFLSAIVKATGASADVLRTVAVVIIFFFGLTLVIPRLQALLESAFSRIANIAPTSSTSTGFLGGVVVGLSLGLVWTPCVGPILASVISLSFTGTVSGQTVFITLAYALGTAIPMLAITYGGRALLQKFPRLLSSTGKIQKVFGILMIITAIAIQFNLDRTFQMYILQKFPNYGSGLTGFEQNDSVRSELDKIQGKASSSALKDSQDFPPAPEIIAGGQWFNSKPLTLAELKGKVVLVDFWTYSCINCIRTLPYVESWYKKYADKGLVVIGVHAPEFEFEKNAVNVKKAIADFGLTYPIVQDNNFDTWMAYSNNFWPAKYFIDKDGLVRGSHFGEGNYDESEKMIQDLLKEAGATLSDDAVKNPTYSVEAQTPETYLGYDRISSLASPEKIKPDLPTHFTTSEIIPNNSFAYSGIWTLSGQYATPAEHSSLTLSFTAQKVFLVMSPEVATTRKPAINAKVRVLLDGKPILPQDSGTDVKDGFVTLDADRLYNLVNMHGASSHHLTLEFLSGNMRVYAFTFG